MAVTACPLQMFFLKLAADLHRYCAEMEDAGVAVQQAHAKEASNVTGQPGSKLLCTNTCKMTFAGKRTVCFSLDNS